MPPYVSGNRTTFDAPNDLWRDLSHHLDFIADSNMDIALLKRLGTNGSPAKSVKTEWQETALRPRSETVTLAAADTVTLTVSDAKMYAVGDLLRIEDEVVRITALASGTTLTIVRGYAGTTAAIQTAKEAISLGGADAEFASAPNSITDSVVDLYNYTQNFSVAVAVSNDQKASLSIDGNTIDGQIERRFIEINRQLAASVLYGIRSKDDTGKRRTMGGLFSFISANVTNVGGAVTVAAIDALILKIVNAGGNPTLMVLSPYQKQKLDALDANLVRIDKKSHMGGNPDVQTWQSGILSHALEIIVDKTIKKDQLAILDEELLEVQPLSNNGVNGAFHLEDATNNGDDGEKQLIRGKYTVKVHSQKAHGYLYGLS